MLYDGPSKIHGNGIFSTEPIKKGDLLVLNKERHSKQGYNNSCSPNVSFSREIGKNHIRWALRDIPVGEELTVNYMYFSGECNCGHCPNRVSNIPIEGES